MVMNTFDAVKSAAVFKSFSSRYKHHAFNIKDIGTVNQGTGYCYGLSRTPFPAGMRKRRGIEQKSIKPNEMKVIVKPLAGLELRWMINVMKETPSAPPTVLNVLRRPTIVATLSGINSMHALFAAGKTIPMPIPVVSSRRASNSALSNPMPVIPHRGRPGARRIVPIETMIKPHTMGHR
jgi:hypothetical protein